MSRGRSAATVPAVADEVGLTSFSGHESFPLRYAWLKKCVDAVTARPDFFAQDDAMVALGVGKNMVRAIRHWGLAARVVEPDTTARGRALRVSALGQLVFGRGGADPYLEDGRTLWLIHWLISTHREKATTWRWAFGTWNRQVFSRDELLRDLQGAALAARVSHSTLAGDIEVFLRTYLPTRATRLIAIEDTLDSPLVELRLLREDPVERRYEFVRGPKPSLDNVTFGFALLEFWDRLAGERDSMSLDDLLHAPGSPARIFRLDESSLTERVEDVERWSRGALLYDHTAGMRQLLRRRRVDALDWLTNGLAVNQGRAA